jgi:hypothetical protein
MYIFNTLSKSMIEFFHIIESFDLYHTGTGDLNPHTMELLAGHLTQGYASVTHDHLGRT